jgi:monolysocardiolipin acyltransferase
MLNALLYVECAEQNQLQGAQRAWLGTRKEMWSRWLVKALAIATVAGAGNCAYVAHYYRPVPAYPGDSQQPSRRRNLDVSNEPASLLVARQVTLIVGTLVSKSLVGCLNSLVVVNDHRYQAWLKLIRERRSNTPLITVANHESCCDDPPLMGGLVPFDVAIDPLRMRWGICTQEICFPRGLPLIHSLAGCGQALPIARGGGLDQGLLYDVARQLAAGRWVHIFPEGRVVQGWSIGLDPLTTRSPAQLATIGRLKWGVGKLIAHSPVTPIVVPFYHKGMAAVMPQHNTLVQQSDGTWHYDNKIDSPIPKTGRAVEVRFGDAIRVDDLIQEYESKHGPLRKVSSRAVADLDSPEASAESWPSGVVEQQLYQAITLRIQHALLALEKEAEECRASSCSRCGR